MENQAEHLSRILAPLGIPVDPAVAAGLGRYQPLLEKWGRRVRLVGRDDPETVTLRHFGDALTLLPFLSEVPAGRGLMDVGSGAGIPGLPLALARPDLSVILVEADARKAAFLAAAAPHLGLQNVTVKRVRAEGRPEAEGLGQADAVVSRALMDPARWVPLGQAYLAPGGRLLAMMGASEPGDESLAALGEAHGLILEQVWRGVLGEAGRRCIAGWRSTKG